MEYSPLAISLPTAAPPDPARALAGNLGAIIERTAEVVEQETSSIGTDRGFDLKASNARKSRCLYELSRAAKGFRESELLLEHGDRLQRLRALLKRNEAAVRAHLQAVGEVAALLQGAIERAQSDGTYGAGGWSPAGGVAGASGWGEF